MPVWAIVAALAALGGGAYVVFSKKGPEDRGAAMARMADIFYRIIARQPYTGNEAVEATNIADQFGMNETVKAMRSSGKLPDNERWPGSMLSVAAFMAEYVRTHSAPPPPPPPGAPKYNDEVPIPPYEDPRVIRQLAINLEKQGKGTEAKLYHAKADGLNALIRATKTKQGIVSKASSIADAAKSLGSIFK